MPIALISHHDCSLHDPGAGHPESPERLGAIQDRLIASGLEMVLRHYDAPLATREQLQRVHAPAYVERLFAPMTGDERHWLSPDTPFTARTLPAARHAAGAAVLAVDLVMRGEASQAFCCVRPPGHHAERAQSLGFCYFNNVAVGAAHALTAHGLERIAILDFDVHYGNGTEDIFRDDGRVLLCSVFQHPFYPYSPAESDRDHIVKVPLPAESDGHAVLEAIRARWLPRLDEFRPQLLLLSAGFDGHAEDDMADWLLTERDYGAITRELVRLGDRHAQGRVVSTLEGGYALSALGRSVVAHLRAFHE